MCYAFEHSGSHWNLEVLVFEGRGKLKYPGVNLSEQRKNQKQTQPTYGPCSEPNARHIGGRQVLLPLRQPSYIGEIIFNSKTKKRAAEQPEIPAENIFADRLLFDDEGTSKDLTIVTFLYACLTQMTIGMKCYLSKL